MAMGISTWCSPRDATRRILDRVLLNDGKGGFTASDLGPIADRTYTAALADLDGDGDLDVLTSNDTPDRKLVYLNDGKGRFTGRAPGAWRSGRPAMRPSPTSMATASPTSIAANRPGPSFVCLNDGGGRFTCDLHPDPGRIGDDYRAGGLRQGRLHRPRRAGPRRRSEPIYFNDGKAGFARTAPFGPPDAAARAGAAADFNGDGATRSGGRRRAGAVADRVSQRRPGPVDRGFDADNKQTPYAIAAGDLNDDGRPDIVLGFTEGPHALFFNDGTGQQFTQDRLRRQGRRRLRLRDRRRNGDFDIAMARSGAPNVLYLSVK